MLDRPESRVTFSNVIKRYNESRFVQKCQKIDSTAEMSESRRNIGPS